MLSENWLEKYESVVTLQNSWAFIELDSSVSNRQESSVGGLCGEDQDGSKDGAVMAPLYF